MNEHSDFLSLFGINRNFVFETTGNNVLLVEGRIPVGEIYFRDGKFGVRFGDYKPSSHQIDLNGIRWSN